MQLSSLDVKMWYAPANSSSGTQWVMMALGSSRPVRTYVFDEPGQQAFNRRLTCPQRQPFVEDIADGHQVIRRTVHPDDGHDTTFFDRVKAQCNAVADPA